MSIVCLGLAGALGAIYWLLRRDALLRDQLAMDARRTSGSEAAPALAVVGMGEQSGQIVVTRPQGFYQDALRRYKIVIDGQKAGVLKRGEVLRHTVAAGPHDVVARIDWSGSRPVRVEVPPGGAVHLTISPGSPLGLLSTDRWLTLHVDG